MDGNFTVTCVTFDTVCEMHQLTRGNFFSHFVIFVTIFGLLVIHDATLAPGGEFNTRAKFTKLTHSKVNY